MKTKFTVSKSPVTQAMLYRVRDELKSKMTSVEAKIQARAKTERSVAASLRAFDLRFESVDQQFEAFRQEMRAGFDRKRTERRLDEIDKGL